MAFGTFNGMYMTVDVDTGKTVKYMYKFENQNMCYQWVEEVKRIKAMSQNIANSLHSGQEGFNQEDAWSNWLTVCHQFIHRWTKEHVPADIRDAIDDTRANAFADQGPLEKIEWPTLNPIKEQAAM